VIPTTRPAATATANLVTQLRTSVIPPATRTSGQPGTAADAGGVSVGQVTLVSKDSSPPSSHSSITAYVGGVTAGNVDLAAKISSKLFEVIAVVLALSFLLLMIAFRSLLVPLQAGRGPARHEPHSTGWPGPRPARHEPHSAEWPGRGPARHERRSTGTANRREGLATRATQREPVPGFAPKGDTVAEVRYGNTVYPGSPPSGTCPDRRAARSVSSVSAGPMLRVDGRVRS
jgi:MMPL family